jgi:transposase
MAFLHVEPVHCLGFDIAKDTITLVDDVQPSPRILPNRRGAIRKALKAYGGDCFAVCEPTGGHEALLLEELVRAAIPCHRADTLKAKAFIRSLGRLAKTDAIDAAALARYGRERWKSLPLWSPPDADDARLQELVRRRRDLVAMRTAEQNRARGPGAAGLAASFKAILAALKSQIDRIERDIDALVARSRALARRVAVCTAMPGIGQASAVALLAFMPELGTLLRRQTASLAGLAPHPNDSGTFKGYRKNHGGRTEIRTVLFMPALRAAAGKGEFADFYKRLVQNGKKPLVAIAAVMRKIIITLNARLRDDLKPQS